MLVSMTKIQVVGHQRCLDAVLEQLYGLGAIQVVDISQDSSLGLSPMPLGERRLQELEELRYLRTRLEALLGLLPDAWASSPDQAPAAQAFTPDMIPALRAQLADITPQVEALVERLDLLRDEHASLPRYARSMERLLPLIPELPALEGYETVALLLSSRHARVLDLLREEMAGLAGSRFELMSANVDAQTIGAILVFPKSQSAQVRSLMGREQVSEVRLPPQLAGLSMPKALSTIERRLQEIPAEIVAAEQALADLVGGQRAHWLAARAYISSRLDQLEVIRRLGATSHTFVLVGWLPKPNLPSLAEQLAADPTLDVTLYEMPLLRQEMAAAPVLMSNPAPAQPFEFLVKLLSLPRYGTIDPTSLMALFLPIFFGMTLGDVAYGVILAVIALILRRRLGSQSTTWRDLSRILLMCAVWSIVFGVIYGEFLGNLGHDLGMQPLWINREQALAPLLIFAIVVGVAHVTLGLSLGAWSAWRQRHGRELMEKVGMLVALSGLFLLTITAVGRLPGGFFTPGIAALAVGLVLLLRAQGALGLMTAPLEILSTMGNMLSYLRIAAIGLSSVYLARVANELAGSVGILWLGIIIAALFHSLNVALGAFSPMIHSLRLHYVEFFGKFYEEGGTAFEPFGSAKEQG